MSDWKLVFGYRHVQGVPLCPCGDPGNYLSMSQSKSDPLSVLFTCWCGRTVTGRMDDQAELDAFLAKNGIGIDRCPRCNSDQIEGPTITEYWFCQSCNASFLPNGEVSPESPAYEKEVKSGNP